MVVAAAVEAETVKLEMAIGSVLILTVVTPTLLGEINAIVVMKTNQKAQVVVVVMMMEIEEVGTEIEMVVTGEVLEVVNSEVAETEEAEVVVLEVDEAAAVAVDSVEAAAAVEVDGEFF